MDSLGLPNGVQLPNNHFHNDPQSDRTSWEYHTVALSRVPGYGFGIAVSGGRDNPHFANGDPSIAVSDVLKAGPAEDRLQVNDRIISVNGISLENVEYATAVQVLRDSGNTVTLVVKRRVPSPNILLPAATTAHHQHSHSLSSTGLGTSGINNAITNGSQQQIKVVLSKSNKKDDFGIVLGCRLFVKEISSKAREQLASNGYSLQEGDLVTRIHNTNCNDAMSLKEAKKIIDGCKERLNLAVLRDITNAGGGGGGSSGMQSPVYSHTAQVSNCSNMEETFLNSNSYSAQNLYVQPPTRPAISTLLDDKSNLTPRGRSRGPLTDISLSQLDRPSTPQGGGGHLRSRSTIDEPPRPPPPRGEDFYSTRRQLYDEEGRAKKPTSEPRYITFQKEGSVGIRLTGGNEVGIFVTAVQQGSPASVQGLVAGDKILKVNDMDMAGVTREEAVLFLLSLQDRIDLIVQYSKDEYDTVSSQQRGDSFHIKTHFHCENPSKGEMAFKAGDVFRVVDTLYNGVVGAWQVLKIGRGHQELQRGVIPNKARAEELATAQFNATKKEMNASESRVSFFRRRRTTHRRSKSLSRENWDDVVFSDSISKFPAYERVVLRHPGFVRPVVLFGPIADLARDRLIKDFPDKYTAPLQGDDTDKSSSKCGIVRLSNIRDIMDRGKHALLDITPNAVDRLNYAQFYPIVIFTKADTKHIIKQLRHGIPKSQHKSSKKLLEQCQKLDRVWSHVFSTSFVLNDADTWYRKLRDAIDQQQSGAVWMSETKPVESLSDDFLFPMTTSRLSYASSPESDLELSPGPSASLSLGNLPHLVKSNSDPSIATNQDNLDRDRELGEGMPPPYTNPYDHATAHGRRVTVDNKYGFSPKGGLIPGGDDQQPSYGASGRPVPPTGGGHQGIYGPELPPRIDRASKPPNTLPTSTPGSSIPSRNSSSLLGTAGTLGRSAQERLFGGTKSSDEHDEYASRNQLLNVVDKRNSGGNSLERQHQQMQDSLDRQQQRNGVGNKILNNNGSYDSVSSYDSFNTTQMTAPNRLGPNAPDDLKSVPNANSRGANEVVASPRTTHGHQDSMVAPNRNSMHEHSRSIDFNGSPQRQQYNGGEMNGRNMGLKSHESLSPRNSGERPTGISIPQRPSNLGIDSPRKHIIETKTDYGKYSRNNSASQADYAKTPKSPQMGPPGPGAPFKPVPPPKPKNYRPPTNGGSNGNGGGAMHSNQWENGEPVSPRSPNGFYYPPTSSHYHQSSQPHMPGSPNANHMGVGHHGQMQAYNQYGGSSNGNGYGQGPPPNQAYMSRGGDPNGFNGNMGYSSNYASRGPGGMGNHIPLHPSDRQALDLAGSREQRGSAFELYRKPQIGTAGHHHMREMEPLPPHLAHGVPYMTEEQYYAHIRRMQVASPPPLPAKPPKKNLLKSPLAAIKNAFIKTTRPLRRQKSLAEHGEGKKPRPILRRQQSMMESSRRMMEMRSPEPYLYAHHPDYYQGYYPPYARLPMRHEPFYPKDGAGEMMGPNTYRNLESESMYGSREQYYEQESLYANRAFIELEKRALEQRPVHGGGRIVRRHSMAAERPVTVQRRIDPSQLASGGSVRARGRDYRQRVTEEPIYQSRRGSYLYHNEMKVSFNDSDSAATTPTDPIYQSRKEMHRDHVRQSQKEAQERIYQSRREVERSSSQSPALDVPADLVYQSRKELKERGFKTRTQLRDQIYQSRREAMESMAEPVYQSRREVSQTKDEVMTASTTSTEVDQSLATELQTLRIEEEPTVVEVVVEQEPQPSTSAAAFGSDLCDIAEIDGDDDDTLTAKNNVSDLEKVAAAKVETPLSRRAMRAPYHISNIIKRTAPPPSEPPTGLDPAAGMFASRTSMETQYTASTASLPVGPPNAQSTPFSSELSLGKAWGAPARGPITTKGIFDQDGGTLTDSTWNVSLVIPKNAIPPGVNQEIYFTVTDPRLSEAVGGPPLDMENGEQMLSPLVMCGPQGLEFLIPVTLNIPHCAGKTASLGLSLKATDSEKNLQTDWDNIDLPSNTAAHTVSVKVDHF